MATPGQDRVERRLAAILAADVAGYSRLMGADEAGTAKALREAPTPRRSRITASRCTGKNSHRIGRTPWRSIFKAPLPTSRLIEATVPATGVWFFAVKGDWEELSAYGTGLAA